MPPTSTSGISPSFPELSPSYGQVVYVLLNRLPLNRIAPAPLDLHTLGTPLAFVLSQDQTLRMKIGSPKQEGRTMVEIGRRSGSPPRTKG